MMVHDIKKIRFLISESFNIINSKNRNPFLGELPKYSMHYQGMALENRNIFTFSRKLETMGKN